MSEPYEIAKDALARMREDLGPTAKFSADQIWPYATSEVPSKRRPAAIVKLHKSGLIVQTGRMRNAAAEKRAGSKTPEYEFPGATEKIDYTDIKVAVPSFIREAGHAIELDEELIRKIVASLLAKPFLILSGLSGSGKTKIAQAFTHWITPEPAWVDPTNQSKGKSPSPHRIVIPVGADWTGGENITGYADGLRPETYVATPALDVILSAAKPENKEVPHFLILDEMNLSHVERYFSAILSAIESGEPIPLHTADRLVANGRAIPPKQALPPNLFIIGTVNVDETTYMFSPKVLDRANVIEFRMTEPQMQGFLSAPKSVDLKDLDGKGSAFGKMFVATAMDKSREVPADVAEQFEAEMLLFFKILQSQQSEFGYRVAYEAARFVLYYHDLIQTTEEAAEWFNDALDAVVVQKLLPKLNGSRGKLEGLLCALAYACGAKRFKEDGTPLSHDDFTSRCLAAGKADDEKLSPESVERALNGELARYPLSFEKVLRMHAKLLRDQFVTFSEA